MSALYPYSSTGFGTWDPFSEFRRLVRGFDTELGRMLPGTADVVQPGAMLTSGQAVMGIDCDVVDKEDCICVHCDMPGMKKEDVQLNISPDNVLHISGSRLRQEMKEGAKWKRCECEYGHFERSLKLPDSIDCDKVDAKMEDGVLKLTICKKPLEQRQGHQIQIV